MALTSVAEAQSRLLASVVPLAVETVPIEAAGGRVLAEDLAARRTQPPFAASAMDGYAVRGTDAGAGSVLTVIGEAAAGRGLSRPVGPGEAARIFTGAPLPEGADTVVIQEDTTRDGDRVTLTAATAPGRNVRPAGLDFAEGRVLLPAGRRLDARALGLAAAMNHGALPVRRAPRVAVLATGDELVAPGTEPVGPDRIVASNQIAIAAMVREFGGEPIALGIAPDDLDAIRGRIRAGLDAGADVIVLLGGASVGDHDLTGPALAAEGVAFDVQKLAMRPGKPLMLGRRGAVHALGLPGNPVSSHVGAVLFLAPLLRALQGETDPLPRLEPAVLGAPLRANDHRQDYLRATLAVDGARLVATPASLQDSSVISVLAASNALIVRPPRAPAAVAGDTVDVVRL